MVGSFINKFKKDGRTKHLPILVGLWVLKNQAGLLAHGQCVLLLPIHSCTVDLQTASIYSGGTALEFHQLPY
ncbi:hypothetical protein AF332_01980 [Sporosarcina globispora]|uniref:Uncharacterized protein n=1 Tax=Sporosarcina globispora TaxID=1459 RepID=A0A0M0G7F8_SPOGL|nr:hypothetical protein AF332_01980 [Sporosarcina globispora]